MTSSSSDTRFHGFPRVRPLVRGTLIGTGAHAATTLVYTWTYLAFGRPDPETGQVSTTWGLVLIAWCLATLVGYVSLSAWMVRVSEALDARGLPVPASSLPFGAWIIPVYWWWGPYATMRDITNYSAHAGIVLPRHIWWAAWVLVPLTGLPTWQAIGDGYLLDATTAVHAAAMITAYAALAFVVVKASAATDSIEA